MNAYDQTLIQAYRKIIDDGENLSRSPMFSPRRPYKQLIDYMTNYADGAHSASFTTNVLGVTAAAVMHARGMSLPTIHIAAADIDTNATERANFTEFHNLLRLLMLAERNKDENELMSALQNIITLAISMEYVALTREVCAMTSPHDLASNLRTAWEGGDAEGLEHAITAAANYLDNITFVPMETWEELEKQDTMTADELHASTVQIAIDREGDYWTRTDRNEWELHMLDGNFSEPLDDFAPYTPIA